MRGESGEIAGTQYSVDCWVPGHAVFAPRHYLTHSWSVRKIRSAISEETRRDSRHRQTIRARPTSLPISVGTDPGLALKTRKGTGLYKVPSLKGVWYRGLLSHDGSVATLEDWFDLARLRVDYIPRGFKGYK